MMFWPYGDVLRMPFTKGISLFEKKMKVMYSEILSRFFIKKMMCVDEYRLQIIHHKF